jgi:hypothetical protein
MPPRCCTGRPRHRPSRSTARPTRSHSRRPAATTVPRHRRPAGHAGRPAHQPTRRHTGSTAVRRRRRAPAEHSTTAPGVQPRAAAHRQQGSCSWRRTAVWHHRMTTATAAAHVRVHQPTNTQPLGTGCSRPGRSCGGRSRSPLRKWVRRWQGGPSTARPVPGGSCGACPRRARGMPLIRRGTSGSGHRRR